MRHDANSCFWLCFFTYKCTHTHTHTHTATTGRRCMPATSWKPNTCERRRRLFWPACKFLLSFSHFSRNMRTRTCFVSHKLLLDQLFLQSAASHPPTAAARRFHSCVSCCSNATWTTVWLKRRRVVTRVRCDNETQLRFVCSLIFLSFSKLSCTVKVKHFLFVFSSVTNLQLTALLTSNTCTEGVTTETGENEHLFPPILHLCSKKTSLAHVEVSRDKSGLLKFQLSTFNKTCSIYRRFLKWAALICEWATTLPGAHG